MCGWRVMFLSSSCWGRKLKRRNSLLYREGEVYSIVTVVWVTTVLLQCTSVSTDTVYIVIHTDVHVYLHVYMSIHSYIRICSVVFFCASVITFSYVNKAFPQRKKLSYKRQTTTVHKVFIFCFISVTLLDVFPRTYIFV